MPSPRTGYAIVAVMLVLAAGAFLRAEQLKLQQSPVARPMIAQHISPRCTGSAACRRVARFSFKLRSAQRVTVAIVDSSGHVVRTIVAAPGRAYTKGVHGFTWDGRTDGGAIVPDGGYRVQIHLAGPGKTITPPDRIVVDSVAPKVRVTSAPGAVPVRYSTSGGQARVYLLLHPPSGAASYVRGHRGVVHVPSASAVQGTVMTLVAVDAAGNRSQPVSAGTIG